MPLLHSTKKSQISGTFLFFLLSRAFGFVCIGAGYAELAGFLLDLAVVLAHSFGRALGFDFGVFDGCIHVNWLL